WSTSKTPSYTKSVSWQHHPHSKSIFTVTNWKIYASVVICTNLIFHNQLAIIMSSEPEQLR
ncbi:hypothetical protein, partial [Escherichia coli]